MVRKIVVSETDLDMIAQEPGDIIPEDKFSEFDEMQDSIVAKRKRKFGKRCDSSRRYVVP